MAAWDKTCLCAILHTDTTTIAWAFGLRSLVIPGPVIGLSGMPYDMARNRACMNAIEIGADFLVFLDSDVIPPKDAFIRLMAHNVPIISGVYFRRSPPHGLPVMIRSGQGWVTDYPKDSVIEVDVVGAGCLCIRRDVLEQMKPCSPGHHWFDWRVDLTGCLPEGFPALSEDFTFCWEAKRQNPNWKTLVDTSIICKHVGLAAAGHNSLIPLDVVPVT